MKYSFFHLYFPFSLAYIVAHVPPHNHTIPQLRLNSFFSGEWRSNTISSCFHSGRWERARRRTFTHLLGRLVPKSSSFQKYRNNYDTEHWARASAAEVHKEHSHESISSVASHTATAIAIINAIAISHSAHTSCEIKQSKLIIIQLIIITFYDSPRKIAVAALWIAGCGGNWAKLRLNGSDYDECSLDIYCSYYKIMKLGNRTLVWMNEWMNEWV